MGSNILKQHTRKRIMTNYDKNEIALSETLAGSILHFVQDSH